jgi:hypothetical protein
LFRATINLADAASHSPMCCEERTAGISVIPPYGIDSVRRVVAYRRGCGYLLMLEWTVLRWGLSDQGNAAFWKENTHLFVVRRGTPMVDLLHQTRPSATTCRVGHDKPFNRVANRHIRNRLLNHRKPLNSRREQLLPYTMSRGGTVRNGAPNGFTLPMRGYNTYARVWPYLHLRRMIFGSQQMRQQKVSS